MWFKRKAQNRRLGRAHVLEVKVRSSQVRAGRARLAAVALAVVFATIFGLYACWRGGEWGLNCLVYDNQAFAINDIDVQTDGVIATAELRRWAGVKVGENLLALDLARVKRDLELVSVIQSASIERILPHTLRIRVVEREPLAQINVVLPRAGGGIEMASFQVDAEGYVMLPLEPRQRGTPPGPPGEQLPLLAGLNSNEIQAGRRIESFQVQAALRWLAAFDQSGMAGLVELKRLDVSAPEVLVVTTGQGSEITFGLLDAELQLRRWQQIYELGQKYSKAIAALDLAVTNNIPARWLEASAVPASAPKLPKPLRLKKKHV